jgi:hypothetical protein
MTSDYHNNAKALVIEAAQRAGMLESIAEVLCWGANTPPPHFAPQRETAEMIIDELFEIFDDHCVMPALVVEKLMAPMTGLESFEIGPYTPEQLMPFMGGLK